MVSRHSGGALLPEEFRLLPPGLEAIDELFDDPVFF
jgi:hypothetical protein